MSYHESFWIVIGTATPVIALATVVALTDIAHASFRMLLSMDDLDDDEETYTIGCGLALVWAIGEVNLAMQAVTLVLALLSLTAGHNQVPVIVPEITVPLGIFLLAASSGSYGVMRMWLKYRAADHEAQKPLN